MNLSSTATTGNPWNGLIWRRERAVRPRVAKELDGFCWVSKLELGGQKLMKFTPTSFSVYEVHVVDVTSVERRNGIS